MVEALVLIFVLGLRHGVDPDHIAIIDNMTLRFVAVRPRLAPWTGSLFALGHSLAVGVIAVAIAVLARRFVWPVWAAIIAEWTVIVLLVVVGVQNMIALRRVTYVPAGWRQALVPRALRSSVHPLATVAVGAIFGLVFDTATQAATWGAAAAAEGGVGGALAVAAAFAGGMILTDTLDSHLVARLLRRSGDPAEIEAYRRGVGIVIVALSFGMAGYALALMAIPELELPGAAGSAVGILLALIIAVVAAERRRSRARS